MISPVSQGGPNIALITIACGWTFVGIAFLGVSLLIWFKLEIRTIGLDDYLTTLAFVITIALVAQTTWAIANEGQDDHEAEMSSTKLALVVRSLLVSQTLWGVVNTMVRMSAILFIEKVFCYIGGIWKTRSLLVLSILCGLVVFLEVFLICRPMAEDWNAHLDGICGDQVVSYLTLEVFGLLLDFIILVIPMPYIFRLQTSRSGKVPIWLVFSIGALVFIITGLRIQALRMVNAQDFTYSKSYLGLLSTLGASLGIIFCCVPIVPGSYRLWRQGSLKRASKTRLVDEENTAAASETPDAISLPVTEDNSTQNRASMGVHINEENSATALETPDEISLPMTEDKAAQTYGRNARWSMEGFDAHASPPPYGELQRHRTF